MSCLPFIHSGKSWKATCDTGNCMGSTAQMTDWNPVHSLLPAYVNLWWISPLFLLSPNSPIYKICTNILPSMCTVRIKWGISSWHTVIIQLSTWWDFILEIYAICMDNIRNLYTFTWNLRFQNSIIRASLVAQTIKNLPAMQETRIWSLVQEDPLEKGMATHSSILTWRIPWTEEPGRLQSVGLHRVGHNWSDVAHT